MTDGESEDGDYDEVGLICVG